MKIKSHKKPFSKIYIAFKLTKFSAILVISQINPTNFLEIKYETNKETRANMKK